MYRQFWKEGKLFSSYPTDGIVLSVNSRKLQKQLDLPSGSYWVQLQADLLDHLKPAKTHWTRLFELNRLLFEFGHLDEYKTMGNKVVTRETEED
jgi:hypothetical protein